MLPFLLAFVEDPVPGAEAARNGSSPIWLFAGIGLIFYFIVLRPEQKRRKAVESMRDGLKKGDRVVTSGGIFATVAQVGDDQKIVLQVADGVRMKFSRAAVQTVQGDTESEDS